MKIFPFAVWLLLCVCILGPALRSDSVASKSLTSVPSAATRFVLDMVYDNPGQTPVASSFCNPKKLAAWGYGGQVVDSMVEGVATFDAIASGILPQGSKERIWADARTEAIATQIQTAHSAGVKCYAWMQVLVLPRAIVDKYQNQICDEHGNLDVHRPKTLELFRAQLHEIFQRLPGLDGLVIRTGEIYLQDLPYHQASRVVGGKTQGSSAIQQGPQSHIDILNVLRDEVCEKQNKTVVYRTWDFGNHFHVNPAYYLQVTNAIEPHPNLIFSIKHQAGDFHQLTPFNPTLGIGQHQQIIEVQCQREGYGKGAHPYYVGQGVIDGWEEYAWIMKPGQPKGLHDIMSNPLIAGVWTWSRGGGWDGPYITNEFWCDLNAYVIAKYAEDPTRTEVQIFNEYARLIGLTGNDIGRFRELCLLSAKAVLRGQLTTLGADINVWWARDNTLSEPNLHDFIKKGLIEKAIEEKHEAAAMWTRIEQLSQQIHFADPATQRFVETSCTYGRLKYSIIAEGWTILLYGQSGDATGTYNKPQMAAAITLYDQLWQQWKELKETHPECATLPKDLARNNEPGLGAAVDRYRSLFSGKRKPTTAN